MARADELEPGERIRHPITEDVVTVVRVTPQLSRCWVYFKAKGQRGKFACPNQKELEEI